MHRRAFLALIGSFAATVPSVAKGVSVAPAHGSDSARTPTAPAQQPEADYMATRKSRVLKRRRFGRIHIEGLRRLERAR